MSRKVVIGIHGMGNKPPSEVLQQWWLESLHEGLVKNGFPKHTFRFELVYWAHLLHPFPYDPTLDDENDALYLREPYVPSAGKPAPKPSRLRKKTLGYIERVLDRLLLNDDLTVNYQSIADSIMRKHFNGLKIYYSAACVPATYKGLLARDVIRADLIRLLRKFRRYDILLVSHSMGTIIAYDVLSADVPDVDIHTFVTMGSPLGLPVIIARFVKERRNVEPGIKAVTTPPNVLHHWYNLSDLEDRVAFNYDLGDDYAPNARGVAAGDKIVYNDYEVRGKANHHKVYGYLRTKEMATILHDFLTENGDQRRPRISDRVQARLEKLRGTDPEGEWG